MMRERRKAGKKTITVTNVYLDVRCDSLTEKQSTIFSILSANIFLYIFFTFLDYLIFKASLPHIPHSFVRIRVRLTTYDVIFNEKLLPVLNLLRSKAYYKIKRIY